MAAEKFVSDIASDAFQYARIRTNAGPGRQRTGAGASRVSLALMLSGAHVLMSCA